MATIERPAEFPGPHGRAMHVVTAIVKRDKNGPAFTRPNPYGLRQPEPGMIARCGNASRGCRGVVGYPRSRYLALREASLGNTLEPPSDAWCITHPEKYRGDTATGYFVLDSSEGRRAKGGVKIGARSVPDRYRSSDEMDIVEGFRIPGPRRIIGQLPEPPCIIFCSTCGMPNWVEAPDGDPAHYRYSPYLRGPGERCRT